MPAYFLQPKNATQAASPNWYSVTYRATGRYKGLGQAMYDQYGNYIGPSVGVDSYGNPIPAPDVGTGANILTPSGQIVPGAFPVATGAAAGITAYLPWIVGGLLAFLLLEGWTNKR